MTRSSAGPCVYVSAGEPSGDRHAAAMVEALRAAAPQVRVEAMGGPHLAASGAVVRHQMEEYSVLGFAEILGAIPRHGKLLRTLSARFRRGCYDLVILVDYPGFHLLVARAARRAGVPVLYYIAPQAWAWRPGRVRTLASTVTRLAVILPFETDWFGSRGVRAEFVGHPLLETGDREDRVDRGTERTRLGWAPTDRVLGLFPGSRAQEVRRLWGPLREAARELLERGQCDRVVVAVMPGVSYPGLDTSPRFYAVTSSARAFAVSDAVAVKSGTSTLEAALSDTPMVVCYRAHPLTAWLARRLLHVPRISLVNLVGDDDIVPELLQNDVTGARVSTLLGPLLDPGSVETQRQREGLARVRARLGTPGAARRVATVARELLAS